MKCKICGSRLNDNAESCPMCGTRIGTNASLSVLSNTKIQKSICPNCENSIIGEHRFCPNCKFDLKVTPEMISSNNVILNSNRENAELVICSKCGTELVKEASFCYKCGTRISEVKERCSTSDRKLGEVNKFNCDFNDLPSLIENFEDEEKEFEIKVTGACDYDFELINEALECSENYFSLDFSRVSNFEYVPIGAFSDCYSLKKIILPDNLISVKSNSFENCESLKEVVVGNSFDFIGSNAFSNCDELEMIHAEKPIRFLCSGAFHGCSKLTKKATMFGTKYLEREAFDGDTNEKNIDEGLISVLCRTYGITNTYILEIGETVKGIGETIKDFKKVLLPAKVQSINKEISTKVFFDDYDGIGIGISGLGKELGILLWDAIKGNEYHDFFDAFISYDSILMANEMQGAIILDLKDNTFHRDFGRINKLTIKLDARKQMYSTNEYVDFINLLKKFL